MAKNDDDYAGAHPPRTITIRAAKVYAKGSVDLKMELRGTSTPPPPEVILQAQLILEVGRNPDGAVIIAMEPAWRAIWKRIAEDPKFLELFAKHPRVFEEFLADAYHLAGYQEVTLTPRSGDGGRDVIAVMRGFGQIRIIDQAKAYSPGRLVTANDVRALLGVLGGDHNASKGVVTTTSDFAPGIATDQAIQQYIPNRLDLVNGTSLIQRLDMVAKTPG